MRRSHPLVSRDEIERFMAERQTDNLSQPGYHVVPRGKSGLIDEHGNWIPGDWRAQHKRGRPKKVPPPPPPAAEEPAPARKTNGRVLCPPASPSAPERPTPPRTAPPTRRRSRGRPPEKDAEISALVAQGLTAREIAERIGRDVGAVRYRCRKMGIRPARPERFTGPSPNEARRAEYSRMHGEGLTVAEMARRMGVNRESVRRMLRRMGLASPHDGRGPDEGRRARYRALVAAGKTSREIAEAMGVTYASVTTMLGRLGLEARRPERHEIRRNPHRGPRAATQEKLSRLREMHAQGATVSEIAAAIGVGTSRVYQLLEQVGLALVRPSPSTDEDKRRRYRELHALGMTAQEIAHAMGVSRRSVYAMLRTLGLPLNPPRKERRP